MGREFNWWIPWWRKQVIDSRRGMAMTRYDAMNWYDLRDIYICTSVLLRLLNNRDVEVIFRG